MKLCNPSYTPSKNGEQRRIIQLDTPHDYAIDIGFPPCASESEATEVCNKIITAVNEQDALKLVAIAARIVVSRLGLSDDTSELLLALTNLATIQRNNKNSLK